MLHDLYGHRTIRRSLAAAVGADTLPASILVHGAPGIGKTRLALWMGQLLLCRDPRDSGPCGACHSCRLALRLEHPDVHWHFPLARPKRAGTPEKLAEALEDARGEELTEIRAKPLRPSWSDEPRAHYLAAAQTIRRRAHRRPTMSSRQLFIISDAETLVPQESSPEAANSLLKLLEEPPGGSRFVLTSSQPGRVLETIRSRCLPLHLSPLAGTDVERFLAQEAEASPGEAARAATLSRGSIGRALGFLRVDDDPGPLESVRDQALELVQGALGDGGERFSLPLGFRPAGARAILALLGFVEEVIRDLAAVAVGSVENVVHVDRIDRLRAVGGALDALALADALAVVERAREDARGNVNPQLIVAGMLTDLRRKLFDDAAAA